MAKKLAVGDQAPAAILINTEDEEINLASLWANGPTLLTFLRHFGCIFCRERLAQLEAQQAEIAAAGLQLIAIGIGEPKHARRYCGPLTAEINCLTNQDADTHLAFGISKSSWSNILTPGLVKATLRAATAGHVQGRATGDGSLLGATFIVDTAGIIQFAHYDAYAGDHSPIPQLLAAFKRGSAHG